MSAVGSSSGFLSHLLYGPLQGRTLSTGKNSGVNRLQNKCVIDSEGVGLLWSLRARHVSGDVVPQGSHPQVCSPVGSRDGGTSKIGPSTPGDPMSKSSSVTDVVCTRRVLRIDMISF
ncbi:hypothetical protein Tco_0236914 [Tanacetum coccineum]